MRSRLMTILVLVVVMAVAGVGVLSAAGNGPLDSLNPSGEQQRLSTPDQANPPLPADDAPLSAACVPGAAYNPACDVDHNGAINVTDIQLTAGHWGQTGTYTAGAAPPCYSNAGRYVDCGNGTVTDMVTGLIWLKDAGCLGSLYYAEANDAASGLQSGACGLTDNSSPGDWRLPTRAEWQETVARAVALGCTAANAPSLTNRVGVACYQVGPQQFIGVQAASYWTSATRAENVSTAYHMNLILGLLQDVDKQIPLRVWPVRGRQ